MELDERYEFDAPRFFNFMDSDETNAAADDWFANAPDGPGTRKAGPDPAPLTDVNAAREPLKSIQEPAAKAAAEAATGSAGPSKAGGNIRTSWGGKDGTAGNKRTFAHTGGKANADTVHSKAAPAEGTKAQRVCVEQQGPRQEAPITRSVMKARQAGPAAEEAGPLITARAKGCETALPAARSRSRIECQTEPRLTRSMARTNGAMTPAAKGGRSPASPKRRGAATTVKPSKTASASALKRVLAPVISRPARSTKPLTLPEDFELATTNRRLRSAGPVQPAPPPEASPFKPLAEKVRDFQNKTPARFKSRARNAGTVARATTVRKATVHRAPHITEAKDPVLWTSTRARPSRFKSRIDEEAEEMEKAEPFHARPVNPEVLHSFGQVGVPRVDKRPTTETQPFSFNTERRATERKSHEHPPIQAEAGAAAAGGGVGAQRRSGTALTRSQGLKRSILDGPVFQPHKDTHALTVPKSPLLMTKLRHHEPKQQEQARYEFRARPVPNYARTAIKHAPPTAAKELTRPQPFHLATESRGAQHSAQQAAQVSAQEAASRAARRVRAQPLPVTTDMPAVPPRPEPKPLTLPAPFRLESEARHEDYQAHRQQELQAEEEARRQEALFKARPLWQGNPYVVHDSELPLTVPEDPHLATEARAPVREEFDHAVADKMAAHEEAKRRAEQEKRVQEEAEIREHRKKLKFEARPMPNFEEPFYTVPSAKALTSARTPNFASKQLPRRSCRKD